jgi:hypothetical protein
MAEFCTTTTRNRRIWCGFASAGHIMDVQPKRVAYAVREERRTHTGRKQCGLIRLSPEDAEFLEASNEYAVTKELHCIPVQTRLEHFDGGLKEVGTSREAPVD